jgi:uncharacterized protein with von Willebrand factor type A (vWA) domain
MKFKKEDQVVKFDRFDQQIWDDVLFDMGALQQNRDEIWEKYDFVNHEFQDLFMSLFQGDPINNERNDMMEDHLFNHMITEQFQTWPEVNELRVSTKFDEYSAAFSMISLQPEIKKLYEDNEKLMEMLQKMKELLEELASTSDLGEAGEIQGQIVSLKEAIENEMDGVAIEFRQSVKDASDELAKEEALMRTFGLEEGQLKRMNYRERRELAERLKSGRMMQFANLLGQFKLVAKGARRSKVSTVPDEVAGLELGQDLTNLSIEALADLANPDTELKFWNGFFNHELVQKKVVGPHSLGKGPIIVVCDESGSMVDRAYGGTREQWSKALSLALCDQARRNKRDFIYIGFSGGVNIYKAEFKKGKINHNILVEFVEHFFGGGTYPYGALYEAAKIVESYPENNRPDIVFITDGEFGEPMESHYDPHGGEFFEEWDRIKRKTNMQTFGIAFDGEPRNMEKLVDTVINLDSLMASPDKMSQVFAAINHD